MKNAIGLLGLLLALALLSGCTQTTQSGDGTTTVTQTGEGTNVDMTVSTDEGEVTIQGQVLNEDDWCQAGSNWTLTSPEGGATWVIVGLESSGEFAGYCHVTYDVDAPDSQVNADFYFKEDGSGFQVLNINGQTIKTEWTGE